METQVAEIVVLDQLTQILQSGGREWVQRHWPMTLSEAIELMEDYLAAWWTQWNHDTSPNHQLTPQCTNTSGPSAGPRPPGKETLKKDRAHRRRTLVLGEPETTAGSVAKRDTFSRNAPTWIVVINKSVEPALRPRRQLEKNSWP